MSRDTPSGRNGSAQPMTDAHDAAAKPMAALLWVVVLAALGYGVVQTLAKVVALFT